MWRRCLNIILALTILPCGTGCQEEPSPAAPAFSPFAFDFSLADVTGKPISLSDLKGKVVVVDIWGTWCPPCRQEVPSFIKLQEVYGSQGFQMVGINFEDRADTEEVQRQAVINFIDEFGINYPCALGTQSIEQQIPNLQVFPTTIFIDKTGTVRSMIVGLHGYTELEERVTELLAE